jgi:Holliday junction resolvasome RuvABC DNA-binding subunit
VRADLLSALVNLGYQPRDVEKTVDKVLHAARIARSNRCFVRR